LTIRKEYQSIMELKNGMSSLSVNETDEIRETYTWDKVGYTTILNKIIFNDLEYDTITPKLPLWYRIYLRWKRIKHQNI